MEAVIQTRGLLSLPTNLRNKVLHSSQGLKYRFLSQKPKPLGGFSLSTNGFQKFHGFISKLNGFGQKDSNLFICKAEATAATVDGQPLSGEIEVERPKFFGIEVTTLTKIIPLGMMFFCILFNYTILRDTKDVLVVTARGSSAGVT